MDDTIKYDENLYSRQLYEIGRESMNKMVKGNILVSCYDNFSGLGTEIVKNILLAGIRNVSLHCNNDRVNIYDQNFYDGTIENISKELEELNPESNINIIKTQINNDDIKKYDLVIFCSYPHQKLYKYSEQDTKIICCDSVGLSGFIFNDFKKHVSLDTDGEPIITNRIKSITMNIITTYDNHKLYSGDIVKLNNILYVVRTVSPIEFEILDHNIQDDIDNNKNVDYDILCYSLKSVTLGSSESLESGLINKEFSTFKVGKEFEHKSLKSLISKYDDSKINLFDMFNINSREMFIFYKCLYLYKLELDTTNTIDYDHEMRKTFDDFLRSFQIAYKYEFSKDPTENIMTKIKNLYAMNYAKITPINSIIGSIVSHQIIKCITNKGISNQFIFYDSLDIVPSDHHKKLFLNNNNNPINIIFGEGYDEYLKSMNIFIVGAGAIGCEHGKNMVMLGTNIVITDMDQIEKSNLSRQFLFRSDDINKSKSIVAKEKLDKMKDIDDIKIVAYDKKVCDDTTDVFDDNFYNNINVVMNALDNVDARVFMDEQCVRNSLPLIESGTLGSKGSVQSIIPFKTKTYSDMIPVDNSSIPICTLKQHPYKYEHLVQYGKDYFHGKFNKDISNLKIGEFNIDSIDIIHIAIREFEKIFNDSVNEILKDKDDKYWVNKMKPIPIEFNKDNNDHLEFILLFVRLYYEAINEKTEIELDDIKYLSDYHTDVKEDDLVISHVNPIEFEKDYDLHIDFVRSLSNLRALNYGMKSHDNFDVKKIAGKIIPAISTTTSLVSGLSAIEVIRVVSEEYFFKEQNFRDGSFNMNIDTYGIGLVSETNYHIINGDKFSKWNLYSNDLTYSNVDDLIDEYELIDIDGETLELDTIEDDNGNIIYEDDEIINKTDDNVKLIYYNKDYEKIEIVIKHNDNLKN